MGFDKSACVNRSQKLLKGNREVEPGRDQVGQKSASRTRSALGASVRTADNTRTNYLKSALVSVIGI